MTSSSTRKGLFRRRRDDGSAASEAAAAPQSAQPVAPAPGAGGAGLVDGVPRTLVVAAGWSWRAIVVAAAIYGLIYLVMMFNVIVAALLIAMLIAVLLEPVASWQRKHLRFPAALASLTSVLALLVVVVGLLTLAGRSIIEGFGELADRFLVAVDDIVVWISELPVEIDENQIQSWIDEGLNQLSANSDVLVSGVMGAASSGFSVATGAVLMLFSLFFFLKDGRKIWHWFVRLAPGPARDRINEAGIRGWMTLGNYTRTQIIVAAVDAVGIGVGAAILGIPLALPIAILVFLFSFIPIIGAVVSGAVAVAVALVDQGPIAALIMLAIVLAVQQAESNILQPWLQGNALALHPLAIVLAVMAGSVVAGILGALFAVPVVATINTVVLYLYGRDKFPKLARDPDRAGGPPGSYAVAQAGEDDGAPKLRTRARERRAGRARAEDAPDETEDTGTRR